MDKMAEWFRDTLALDFTPLKLNEMKVEIAELEAKLKLSVPTPQPNIAEYLIHPEFYERLYQDFGIWGAIQKFDVVQLEKHKARIERLIQEWS